MAKITDEMIERIPGLRAARDNSNIEFIVLDTEDTSPAKTEGFTDEQIKEMNPEALQQQINQINAEEQRLSQMQADVQRRRNTAIALLRRKSELEDGVHN